MRLYKRGKLIYLTQDKLEAQLPELREAAEREEKHYYHKDYVSITCRRKLKTAQERLVLLGKGYTVAAIKSNLTLINYKIVYNHGKGWYGSSFKVARKPGWTKVTLDELIADVMPLYLLAEEEKEDNQ